MDFRYLLNKKLATLLAAMPEDFNVLAMALESTNSGVVITDYRLPDNPIVFCNHAFENLTGYSREEVIGKNCRFLQGDDLMQDSAIILHDGINKGLSLTIELRNYHKNGTLFWNELSIAPVRDFEGKVTHYIGIQNDITRKKTLQTDLMEQIDFLNQRLEKQNRYIKKIEEILFGIIKTSHECLVVLDENLHVVKANSNFYNIFHQIENEIIGMPFKYLHNGQWNDYGLLVLLSNALTENKPFKGYSLKIVEPNEKCKDLTISGNKIEVECIPKDFLLVTIRCTFNRDEHRDDLRLLTLD